MIELQDGMLLYHGSYIGIPAIDLNRCFGGLDFGRGFILHLPTSKRTITFSFRLGKRCVLVQFQKISTRKTDRYLFTNSTTIPTY